MCVFLHYFLFQVATLQNKISMDVSQINELKQGIENAKNTLTDKNKQIENLKAQLVDVSAYVYIFPNLASFLQLFTYFLLSFYSL